MSIFHLQTRQSSIWIQNIKISEKIFYKDVECCWNRERGRTGHFRENLNVNKQEIHVSFTSYGLNANRRNDHCMPFRLAEMFLSLSVLGITGCGEWELTQPGVVFLLPSILKSNFAMSEQICRVDQRVVSCIHTTEQLSSRGQWCRTMYWTLTLQNTCPWHSNSLSRIETLWDVCCYVGGLEKTCRCISHMLN